MSHRRILLDSNCLLKPVYHYSFNQVTIAYDATKEEKVQTLKEKQDAVRGRLRA